MGLMLKFGEIFSCLNHETRNLFFENSLVVADLMLEALGSWNTEFIDNLLVPRDAQLIQQVSLCDMGANN